MVIYPDLCAKDKDSLDSGIDDSSDMSGNFQWDTSWILSPEGRISTGGNIYHPISIDYT